MKRNLRSFSLSGLALLLLLSIGLQGVTPAAAADPNTWQDGAAGLNVDQNAENKTAGLGFIVQAGNWPVLSLRGGAMEADAPMITGPTGIELGAIMLGSGSASLSGQVTDWAHNELTFSSGGSEMKLWVSRITPAVLVQNPGTSLRLLAGDVVRRELNGVEITTKPAGPVNPKYVAYPTSSGAKVQALSSSDAALTGMNSNWMVIWYGSNSHIVDTKKPMTYSGDRWQNASLPGDYAYQADTPILVVFQNAPASIRNSSAGGVEITFSSAGEYLSLLPLFGRESLKAAETEAWSSGLPAAVKDKAQWWAARLCSFPVSVDESYAYDSSSDTATITESFSFISACSGGVSFAPLPPMLAVAKDAVKASFSGTVVSGNLNTEFGPMLGIEGASDYSWSISGLRKYTDMNRSNATGAGAPAELETELASQVQKVIEAGHLAPWVFSDRIPRYDIGGDVYMLNPGEVIYTLTEIASVLNEPLRSQLVQYIKSELASYPPETVFNLPLNEGTVRPDFALHGKDVFERLQKSRQDIFLEAVPLYNFYALARYYDLTGETPSTQVWQKTNDSLDRDMSEQDWATLGWFFGHQNRRVSVIAANQHFAGLLGYIRLARKAGDTDAENLGRALLAKAAVLRAGMARYPRYLYSAHLVELPASPNWQVEQLAGRWYAPIFNYGWSGPMDDHRQVAFLSQFEVYLYDHSGFGDPEEGVLHTGGGVLNKGVVYPYLTPFRDMVPELGSFLGDDVRDDVKIYIDTVTALFPHWYAAFAEGMLGSEHNLSHPIDSYQIFMAKAWVERFPANEAMLRVDIPWLQTGDLFYLHKLAETIRLYRGY